MFKWGFCGSAKSCGGACQQMQSRQYPFWSNLVRKKKKKDNSPNILRSLWENHFYSFLSCWFKFLLHISKKVWFNLQSANCSHSLCTTTLPPGIPVLQSLETSFLRWACAGRFIWAWNCTHHRNIESNQARLQQKGHLGWVKLDILVVQ